MPLVVRAFPVLRGKEGNVRALAAEIAGPRQADACDFYHRLGVTQESWHLQETSMGSWVIAVTQVTGVPEEVARGYAQSEVPFDRWFKTQVLSLSGIDPETEPLGPPTEKLFDWKDD